jgi:pimeloyl-ACP methyl ester carboxylesterase
MQVTTARSTESIPGQYWQWRGHKVYYVKAGESQSRRSPLLLIHGFGASTDHWRHNINGLCEDFEVYAIDLLGYGRSAKPKLDYSTNLWRDQLYDFINQVIGKPVVFAGNSLGGYVSLCVAAQFPDIAAGLVLLNSAGQFSSQQEIETKEGEVQNKTENKTENKKQSIGQKILGNTAKWIFKQKFAQFILFQYLRQPWTIRRTLKKVYLDKNAITNQLVEDIHRPSCDDGAFDVFASLFSTTQRQGEKNDILLQQLGCPLLLIWGEADPWMNSQNRSQKFREYYPQLTEHFLKAGHCPHDEVPSQVNSLLKNWVLEQL